MGTQPKGNKSIGNRMHEYNDGLYDLNHIEDNDTMVPSNGNSFSNK